MKLTKAEFYACMLIYSWEQGTSIDEYDVDCNYQLALEGSNEEFYQILLEIYNRKF